MAHGERAVRLGRRSQFCGSSKDPYSSRRPCSALPYDYGFTGRYTKTRTHRLERLIARREIEVEVREAFSADSDDAAVQYIIDTGLVCIPCTANDQVVYDYVHVDHTAAKLTYGVCWCSWCQRATTEWLDSGWLDM